ncbi:MAG: CrcB family protein, partial [Nitriliruptorales bacterium]|nr:CrcB family protein [Nitriliruptorales bacterium]
ALLGALAGMADRGALSADVLTVLGTGFCGGFTTFSTWMVESVRLGNGEGRSRASMLLLNVGGMFVAGVLAAAIATNLA